MIKPRLVISTTENVKLIWQEDNLLTGCDGEVLKLFEHMFEKTVERPGYVFSSDELRAIMPHFRRPWQELCTAIDLTIAQGSSRGSIYYIALPEGATKDQALFYIEKTGKGFYKMGVRSVSPFVSLDISPRTSPAPKARPQQQRLETASAYISSIPRLRGTTYSNMRHLASDAIKLLDENDKNPENLRLLSEAYFFRAVSFWVGDDGTGKTQPQSAWLDIEKALRFSHLRRDITQEVLEFQVSLLTQKAWLAADLSVLYASETDAWYEVARETLAETNRVCSELGDKANRFDLLNTQGYVLSVFGKYERAREYLEQAREGQRSGGEEYVSGVWADVNVSSLYLKSRRNDVSSARQHLSHATKMLKQKSMLKDQSAAWNLDQLVKVASVAKNWTLTVELLGASLALHQEVGSALTPPERLEIDKIERAAKERIGTERWLQLLGKGAAILSEDDGLKELLSRTLSE